MEMFSLGPWPRCVVLESDAPVSDSSLCLSGFSRCGSGSVSSPHPPNILLLLVLLEFNGNSVLTTFALPE